MVLAFLLLIALGMRQVFRIVYQFSPPPPGPIIPLHQTQHTPWRILLLHSYHQGFSWTDNITRGVRDALMGHPYDLTIEYMETKRHFGDEYFSALDRMLRVKHDQSKYQLIISTDDDAYRYVQSNRNSLFAGIPWVYAGVNYLSPDESANNANATGISEVADLAGNVELILQVLPATRKIVVIADDTITGRKIQEKAGRLRFPALELLVPPGLDFDGLGTMLEQLEAGTVVLNTIFFRDSMGTFKDFDESARFMDEHSRVPVFSTWDFSLGFGSVGGKLVSGFQQGLAAGNYALRILNGEDAKNLPLVLDNNVETVFDFRAMERFGIPGSVLPPGSRLVNHPGNKFQENRELVVDSLIFVGILMMALLFASTWLVSLKRKNETLQHHVEAQTAELVKSEKLALLGGAVASISHEVNAPLGLCVTASSFLAEQTKTFNGRVTEGSITKNQLNEYMKQCDEVCQILLDQLGRAGTLMANFKELAVDQTQESRRTIKLDEYLQKIALSFKPRFRASGHELELHCPSELTLTLQPGALYQVMNNLILNALLHGLSGHNNGHVQILVENRGDRVEILVENNGQVIDDETMKHIFEPYFTTKREQGGTGLGLHITRNLVEHALGGTISCTSQIACTRFTLSLPLGS